MKYGHPSLTKQKEYLDKMAKQKSGSKMAGKLLYLSIDIHIYSQTDTSSFHERCPPNV